jgi:hypothetical protein
LQLLLQLREFFVNDIADVPGIYFTHEHKLHTRLFDGEIHFSQIGIHRVDQFIWGAAALGR